VLTTRPRDQPGDGDDSQSEVVKLATNSDGGIVSTTCAKADPTSPA
jgi:hypothetical protein